MKAFLLHLLFGPPTRPEKEELQCLLLRAHLEATAQDQEKRLQMRWELAARDGRHSAWRVA